MNFELELNKVEFDEYGEVNIGMLYDFVDLLETMINKRNSIPYIFDFIEKNFDKDLGSPGPLIHFLETANDYHDDLKKSVMRQPTVITLWMVNRIINGASKLEKSNWIFILESVASNISLDEKLRAEATDYLEFQRDEI